MVGHAVWVHEDQTEVRFSWAPGRATGTCFASQKTADVPLSFGGLVTWSAGQAVSDDGTAAQPEAMIPDGCQPESPAVTHAGSRFGHPTADGFGHAMKFGIGAAFNVVVSLQFQRDVLRPALGAFDEAVVERGHAGSRGIYTKSGMGRCVWTRSSPQGFLDDCDCFRFGDRFLRKYFTAEMSGARRQSFAVYCQTAPSRADGAHHLNTSNVSTFLPISLLVRGPVSCGPTPGIAERWMTLGCADAGCLLGAARLQGWIGP